MTTRTAIKLLPGFICLGFLWAVFSQGNQVSNLREEQKRLLSQLTASSGEVKAPEPTSLAVPAPVATNSNELLRLRNEVNQLTRRKKELASVQPENDRLRVQLASAGTNKHDILPSGYVRKSVARNAGYTTPEATVETLLWAAQNKDLKAFLEGLAPETAKSLQASFARSGKSMEEIFKSTDQFPGFRILSKEEAGPGEMKLSLEIAPGMEPALIKLRLINGQWKQEM
jgi:hypothetical protein